MFDRPTIYFRRKGNGAVVYRVTEGEHGQLDMLRIAVLKGDGEVKPQGKHQPTEAELDTISEWHAARNSEQKQGDAALVDQLVTDMNEVTQWMQAKATDQQISESAEDILMAMHDMRSTLVRRLSKNK